MFAAKFSANSLELEGVAPYRDLAEIQALAPSLSPGAATFRALAPAGGSPREFSAAVAVGLRALTRLAQGELVISDRLVTLSGEAKPGNNVGEELALKLPQGYGLVLRLTAPTLGTP